MFFKIQLRMNTMKKVLQILLVLILFCGAAAGTASAADVVTTMPNVADVVQEIGGDKVTVIYVAPPTSVHISSDTIDSVLQQNSDFIQHADLFIGQGGGMDGAAITKLTEFYEANFGKKPALKLFADVEGGGNIVYDNPADLRGYAETAAKILCEADPANKEYYEKNLAAYLKKIDAAVQLTVEEAALLSDTPVICHFRIQNQAVNWLGMQVISAYPQPKSVMEIIDDIHANPDKYKDIAAKSKAGRIFVIENTVAGQDIGKAVHEALSDEKIPCKRVIFVNLPKSAAGTDTILDYYAYNKALILDEIQAEPVSSATAAAASPLSCIPAVAGLVFGMVCVLRRE